MSPSSYTLRCVEPSDKPALGELLYTSKLGLTINRLLFKDWPNEAVQRQNYLTALEALDCENAAESLTVVDNATGAVIGHLALTRRRPPPEASTEDKDASPPASSVPEFFNPEVFKAVMTAVGELDQDVKAVDHYDMTYIVVNPAFRHQGIGKDLMQYVFGKAKAAGVSVAVGAEPQVYDFFVQHGFKETRHVDLDLAQWAPPHSGFGTFRLAQMVWSP